MPNLSKLIRCKVKKMEQNLFCCEWINVLCSRNSSVYFQTWQNYICIYIYIYSFVKFENKQKNHDNIIYCSFTARWILLYVLYLTFSPFWQIWHYTISWWISHKWNLNSRRLILTSHIWNIRAYEIEYPITEIEFAFNNLNGNDN